jgi:phospholipase/lecithinase/hemolysin
MVLARYFLHSGALFFTPHFGCVKHFIMRFPLVVLCLVLFFVRPLSANASDLSKFKRLVVFGDSLSDNGNSLFLFDAPQPPYYKGRWSNGPNWVDYFPSIAHHFRPVAAYFPNPDNEDGTNFAVYGSVSPDLLQSEPLDPPAQILVYLSSTGGVASADDLYVIWIGTNDFRAGISPSQTVANIRNGIIRLWKAGAKSFAVINVPDISLTPVVIASGAAVVQAAKQFVYTVNVLLYAELLSYAWSHGIEVHLVDINFIFTLVVNNPAKFGFTNSAGAAFNPTLPVSSSNPVSDPNDYVFWDGFHPTTKAHLIAAEFIYRALASKRFLPEALPVPLARLDFSNRIEAPHK